MKWFLRMKNTESNRESNCLGAKWPASCSRKIGRLIWLQVESLQVHFRLLTQLETPVAQSATLILPFPWEWSAQFGGSLRQWEKQECQQRLQRWGWDSSLICKRWKLMGVHILRVRIQNDSTVGVRQPYERLLWKGRFSLVCLVDIHVYWSMAFESVDPVAFEGTVARSLGQDWRPQRHQDALNLLWNHVIFFLVTLPRFAFFDRFPEH